MTGRARRRDRRAARAARRESEFNQSESREGLASELLMDQKFVTNDLKLIKKSLRWGLTGKKRRCVVDRLCKIAEKEYTTRVGPEGDEILDEELAEKHALEAMKILVAIGAQEQRDEHLDRRLTHGVDNPKQTTINVGVNVDNRIDEERTATLAIAKRIRESRILPVVEPGGT